MFASSVQVPETRSLTSQRLKDKTTLMILLLKRDFAGKDRPHARATMRTINGLRLGLRAAASLPG